VTDIIASFRLFQGIEGAAFAIDLEDDLDGSRHSENLRLFVRIIAMLDCLEPRMQQRTCLKCQKHFNSFGPGNRICAKCTQSNRNFGPVAESVLASQRGVKRHNGLIITHSYSQLRALQG
jgi:protein-arginine kinase activator protein McsA